MFYNNVPNNHMQVSLIVLLTSRPLVLLFRIFVIFSHILQLLVILNRELLR